MLTVKTKLGKSEIAGIGLFADEFIPKDTIIWEYEPGLDIKFSSPEYDSIIDPIYKKFLNTYCFKYNNEYYLCVDNGRFFNHSNTPNCYSDNTDAIWSTGVTKALRDIEKDEERIAFFNFSDD